MGSWTGRTNCPTSRTSGGEKRHRTPITHILPLCWNLPPLCPSSRLWTFQSISHSEVKHRALQDIWTSATVYIVAKGEQWQWVINPANSTLEQPPNVAKCLQLNSFSPFFFWGGGEGCTFVCLFSWSPLLGRRLREGSGRWHAAARGLAPPKAPGAALQQMAEFQRGLVSACGRAGRSSGLPVTLCSEIAILPVAELCAVC